MAGAVLGVGWGLTGWHDCTGCVGVSMRRYRITAYCNAPYNVEITDTVECSDYGPAARQAACALLAMLRDRGKRRRIDGEVTIKVMDMGSNCKGV